MMKKSQGEIFGIALLFVVIIIGVIVYAKIQSVNDVRSEDSEQEAKYKILSESSINSLIKVSTSCQVERDRDTLKDLINFCLENEYAGNDPEIECGDGIGVVRACSYAINIMNQTLFKLFHTNSSQNASLVPILFDLNVDVLSNRQTFFTNKSFNNFNVYTYKNVPINENNLFKYGFKRAPSGLVQWSTAQRNIEFSLYLYYR